MIWYQPACWGRGFRGMLLGENVKMIQFCVIAVHVYCDKKRLKMILITNC